jgi:hypothetical protein
MMNRPTFKLPAVVQRPGEPMRKRQSGAPLRRVLGSKRLHYFTAATPSRSPVPQVTPDGICFFTCSSPSIPIYISIHIYIFLSISISLSLSLSVYRSIYLSIHTRTQTHTHTLQLLFSLSLSLSLSLERELSSLSRCVCVCICLRVERLFALEQEQAARAGERLVAHMRVTERDVVAHMCVTERALKGPQPL